MIQSQLTLTRIFKRKNPTLEVGIFRGRLQVLERVRASKSGNISYRYHELEPITPIYDDSFYFVPSLLKVSRFGDNHLKFLESNPEERANRHWEMVSDQLEQELLAAERTDH